MTVSRFSTGAIRDNALATNVSFAASDMELISTIRVGSGGVASVTFSGIPQEYKHLQIRSIANDSRASNAVSNIEIRFNGDTGSNYSSHYLYANSTTTSSGFEGASQTRAFYARIGGNTIAANCFGASIADILDYTNASKYKTVRVLSGVEDNTTNTTQLWFSSALWLSNSAVTSITLLPITANFKQFSRFSLYGIRG